MRMDAHPRIRVIAALIATLAGLCPQLSLGNYQDTSPAKDRTHFCADPVAAAPVAVPPKGVRAPMISLGGDGNLAPFAVPSAPDYGSLGSRLACRPAATALQSLDLRTETGGTPLFHLGCLLTI